MNRLDPSFHEVDPQTARPFSHGQPDGVWIIGILYSLITTVAVLFSIGTLIAQKGANLVALAPGVGALVLLVAPVVMLFMREKFAVIWLVGLAILVATVLVLAIVRMHQADHYDIGQIVLLSLIPGLQLYAAIYSLLLKADDLLK